MLKNCVSIGKGSTITAGGQTLSFQPCASCGGDGVHFSGVEITGRGAVVTNPTCSKCGTPVLPVAEVEVK